MALYNDPNQPRRNNPSFRERIANPLTIIRDVGQQNHSYSPSFATDYLRNAGQLGKASYDTAKGITSYPTALLKDQATNIAKWATGSKNTNPYQYRSGALDQLAGGLNALTNQAERAQDGIRSLAGWEAADTPVTNQNTMPSSSSASTVNQNTQTTNTIQQSQAQPTSVAGVTRQLINGVPTFSNVPNQGASGLGSIPSLRQSNIRGLLQQGTQQIPAYNQGTQYSTVEDATTGGYYQKRSADRANQRTMQRLTDANKEAWGLNRQATIDNSQLENNSLTRQLLGTQAETAQRINNLDRTIANFDASPQERMAALQTRNLLNQGAQRQQNNVVTKIAEELPDGSKRERAVTIDPSTGEQVGGSNQQVSRSDISKLAQSTGRSEDEVINQLRALGVDIS